MEFEQSKHTKEFLMTNAGVALELAEKSEDFAVSELADDFDILSLRNSDGRTVAHYLAKYQSEWLSSNASKDPHILRLKHNGGTTVAHALAYQKQWLSSVAAKDPHVLRLRNIGGYTVAHALASQQQQWISSDAVRDHEILGLEDDNGTTVANVLIAYNNEWHNYEFVFHKNILSLNAGEKLLAEIISIKYGKSYGMDVLAMALKMITQGAAYKHSKPLPLTVGESLIKQVKTIVNDSMEPLVTLKQIQALYSTFHHQIEKMKLLGEIKTLNKWQLMLVRAQGFLENHLNANPQLFEVEHSVDIFCEPGDDFLKKMTSERVFKELSGVNHHGEPPAFEISSEIGLY